MSAGFGRGTAVRLYEIPSARLDEMAYLLQKPGFQARELRDAAGEDDAGETCGAEVEGEGEEDAVGEGVDGEVVVVWRGRGRGRGWSGEEGCFGGGGEGGEGEGEVGWGDVFGLGVWW